MLRPASWSKAAPASAWSAAPTSASANRPTALRSAAGETAGDSTRDVVLLGLGLSPGLLLGAFQKARARTRRTEVACRVRVVASARVALRAAGTSGTDEIITSSDAPQESVEEAMMRLSETITKALKEGDLATAAKAQREMRQVQFDRPSEMCRNLIEEDCRRATSILRQGDSVTMQARIQATKKLGRWLRWQRFASKSLVPPHMVLEGLLCALRSQPEVAWTAQCALFHAARCADLNRNAKERETISRILLNETAPFPLCLPDLSPRALNDVQRAMETLVVRSFLDQLKGLTVVDPGYGDDPDFEDVDSYMPFARMFGRSFKSLETLRLLGFEDVAIVLFLPFLNMPNLRTLHIVGALQTPMAQESVVFMINRHSETLEELVLNVWTEFLYDAEDPLVECEVVPNLKRLTVRAPAPVPWEHFATTFPNLEELTFLYDQDFALNSMGLLEEHGEPNSDLMAEHASMLYRDAVIFARDLHLRGFRRMERQCKNLQEIRLAVADTSFDNDTPSYDDRMMLAWGRTASTPKTPGRFGRDDAVNNRTRRILTDKSEPAGGWNFAQSGSNSYRFQEVNEEQASAGGAAAMLQVMRLFDDPSLERALRMSSTP